MAAIRRSNGRHFLRIYRGDGTVEKSFDDFASDLEGARLSIRALPHRPMVVCCLGTNSYEMLVYMVAVLMEGITLCPVNATDGDARIEKKLAALGQGVVVFAEEGANRAACLPLRIPDGAHRDISAPVPFSPGHPFILIFTSGTTGDSKIVQQTETGVLTNVDALIEAHGLMEPRHIGTMMPVTHVNALEFSFFCSLLSGGRLTLIQDFHPGRLARLLTEDRPEILSLVPSAISALLAYRPFLEAVPGSGLRYIVSAAAPLSAALAKKIREKMPVPVFQGYGLSESVNFSCLTPPSISPKEYDWCMAQLPRPSVGAALRGSEVSVFREDGRPAEEGETGEICIRGQCLMSGYRGEEQSTALHDGWLHTGDLGHFRRSPEGREFFFVTGRKKEIVKRMGFAISLAEIEDLVSTYAADHFESIAVGFENDASGEEVAVIVKEGSGSVALSALRDHLATSLPAHLRPRLFLKSRKPVRMTSGKPARNSFADELSKYRAALLPEQGLLVEEGD